MHQHGESVGVRVMPELRQDRFTKEWVFVASEDIKHPHELIVQRARKPMPSFDPNCPFCPGRENHTAPEILRVPSLKGGTRRISGAVWFSRPEIGRAHV